MVFTDHYDQFNTVPPVLPSMSLVSVLKILTDPENSGIYLRNKWKVQSSKIPLKSKGSNKKKAPEATKHEFGCCWDKYPTSTPRDRKDES